MSWRIWEEVTCGGPKALRSLSPHFTNGIREDLSYSRDSRA